MKTVEIKISDCITHLNKLDTAQPYSYSNKKVSDDKLVEIFTEVLQHHADIDIELRCEILEKLKISQNVEQSITGIEMTSDKAWGDTDGSGARWERFEYTAYHEGNVLGTVSLKRREDDMWWREDCIFEIKDTEITHDMLFKFGLDVDEIMGCERDEVLECSPSDILEELLFDVILEKHSCH